MISNFAILGFGLLLFVGLESCDENEPLQEDYRDQVVGTYQVVEKIKSYGFSVCGEPYSSERDTMIDVIYGVGDSTLHVLGRTVVLDERGVYYHFRFGLRIWKDSIYSTDRIGGNGCGEGITYEGVKI